MKTFFTAALAGIALGISLKEDESAPAPAGPTKVSEVLNAAFDQVDTNDDGFIDIQEQQAAYEGIARALAGKLGTWAVEQADTSGDG